MSIEIQNPELEALVQKRLALAPTRTRKKWSDIHWKLWRKKRPGTMKSVGPSTRSLVSLWTSQTMERAFRKTKLARGCDYERPAGWQGTLPRSHERVRYRQRMLMISGASGSTWHTTPELPSLTGRRRTIR